MEIRNRQSPCTISSLTRPRGSDLEVSLCRLPAINNPRNPEPIDEHTKSRRPKCILERNLDSSLFCQGIKYAVGFCVVLDAEHYSKTFRFPVMRRLDVSAGQHRVPPFRVA